MKVEFEHINKKLAIKGYAIRETDTDSHFQAFIFENNLNQYNVVNCVFSYYTDEDKKISEDKRTIWTDEFKDMDTFVLSCPITVPEETEKTVVQFYVSSSFDLGVYYKYLAIASLTGLVSLAIYCFM